SPSGQLVDVGTKLAGISAGGRVGGWVADAVDQLLLGGDGAVLVGVGGLVGLGAATGGSRIARSTRTTRTMGPSAALGTASLAGAGRWAELAALDCGFQVGLGDGAGLPGVDRGELLGRVVGGYALG